MAGKKDLLAHRAVILPRLVELAASDLAKSASNSNATKQVGASDLLHEAQAADLVLPVCDVYHELVSKPSSEHLTPHKTERIDEKTHASP